MHITVVGTGYVGLVAGTCFAEAGNDVMCLDIDEAKVARLQGGEVPIYEPGLKDLFERNTREGRLKFTARYEDAVTHASIYFLCLPTPPGEDGAADTTYVLKAARTIAQTLVDLDAKDGAPKITASQAIKAPLFVCKSTVPVGTSAKVAEAVSGIYPARFAVASNPEFLKEGNAVDDFLKPDRVVVGTDDDAAWESLRTLYEPFCRTGAPIVRMDPASSELTKYAANCFLATKISFMNEISRLCVALGADVELVRRGITLDPRIGKSFLFPGLGYGGSCFPKDTRALVASAKQLKQAMSIVEAAEAVNLEQKTIFVPSLLRHLAEDGGSAQGKTVAIWGLAFKPRTDDIREAPALDVIDKLLPEGVKVRAFDPEAMDNVRAIYGDKITYCKNPYEAATGADAVMLITEWNEFRTPDWDRVEQVVKRKAIFDGRNIYDPKKLMALGFVYHGIGRRLTDDQARLS